jgi:glycosyltransferase involved in cell wall biosynthesis
MSEESHSPNQRLDVLAVAPLPYRLAGRGEFQLGGAFYCAELLTGLARLGHRVRALASGPQPSRPGEPEPLAGVDVEWFALDFRSAATPPPADYVAGQRRRFEAQLDLAVSDRRPDLVLLGSEGQAWYSAEACRARNLPTLLVAHGVPTAALGAGIYPPAATEALVAHLGQVDRVVTVARHLEVILRDLDIESVETIPTAVDSEVFQPADKDPVALAELGLAPENFVVGSFSHLRPEKRMLDIVASAEAVLRAEPRTIYVVVGDGPERLPMERLVTAKGLERSFRFLGELDHEDVPAHLALCDVVVLASEREGCSLICREAQAAGRALIVSDIPAGREVVDGGTAGLLFRLGDHGHLADQIVELARNSGLRRSLAEKGRAIAVANSEERWLRSFSDAIVRTATRADLQ